MYMTTARLEEGPLSGQCREVRKPLQDVIRFRIATDTGLQTAEYILWDNWPIRYLFRGYKKEGA